MTARRLVPAAFLVLMATATFADRARNGAVHVGCAASGPECARALQEALDRAPAGTVITLDPGKTYEGTIVIRPKADASSDRRIRITTRGWTDKGAGWDGLVNPADKPRMAVLRATPRENVGVEIQNGPTGGHVELVGLAFEAVPPGGQGDIIRIGSPTERDPANMARQVTIRQVLLEGDRRFGQKRAIAVHGQDVDIRQIWCAEIFIAGQDAQCIGTWNGGKRVHVQHAYLSAGAEALMVGGAPLAAAEMEPEDWVVEDLILHKPLRWQQDGANRQVKNLLEFKFGRNLTARRILAVNNWRAAQDGTGLLINYTTNGRCPQCGNLEKVLVEDLVMLNVAAGISFQGYSHVAESHSAGKLLDVTIRNAFVEVSAPGRALQVANVLGRHDIRVERSTFVNRGTSWLVGSHGYAWTDDETRVRGGAMQGLWLLDNVFAANGTYGITAPDGTHYGQGIGAFVDADLQIAGNVLGDAPGNHLSNYNEHTGGGARNVSAPGDALRRKLTAEGCVEWAPGKGADCARLAPIFALRKLLPEP